MTAQVAIVGAGAAGAGAAYALRETGIDVTVYEKSQGVCGRAATRHQHGCTYDYGANYIKSTDDRIATLVTEALDTEGLIDIDEPIWTFDAEGTIAEGRDADDHKWTYTDGISQLAARLFEAAEATVHNGVRVDQPDREEGGWRLRADDGTDLGWFDALLLTPPAPQTSDLLGAANWEHKLCQRLRRETAAVPFRTIVSAVLHYPAEIDCPYYGLVNTDNDHDIGWVSREECKPGHVPDGESLLIVQLSHDWSVDHYDLPETELVDAAADKVANLLDEDRLATPDWTDLQHWRYAQPDEGIDDQLLDRAATHELFCAGDWVAGEGRVHTALRSGLETGEQIATHLAG